MTSLEQSPPVFCKLQHCPLKIESKFDGQCFFFLGNQSLQVVVGLTSGWPKTLREIFDCSQNKIK